MKTFYLPTTEAQRALWIQNFADKLPTYAAKYGILSGAIDDVQLGAANYGYWIGIAFQQAEYSKKLNAFKNDLANGSTGVLTAPITPVVGPAPTLVPSGIFKRISTVVDGIKKSSVYAQNDGLDLGIEGTPVPARDTSTLKPVISARIVTDGRPEIVWTKGNTDGIEIQVDKGNGTWQFLGIDLKPNYVDNSTLPEVGKTQLWRYRAIYIEDQSHIGQWADVVEIPVVGTI